MTSLPEISISLKRTCSAALQLHPYRKIGLERIGLHLYLLQVLHAHANYFGKGNIVAFETHHANAVEPVHCAGVHGIGIIIYMGSQCIAFGLYLTNGFEVGAIRRELHFVEIDLLFFLHRESELRTVVLDSSFQIDASHRQCSIGEEAGWVLCAATWQCWIIRVDEDRIAVTSSNVILLWLQTSASGATFARNVSTALLAAPGLMIPLDSRVNGSPCRR